MAAAAYDGQIRELRSQLEQELRAHHASREGMAEIRLESEKTKMKLEQLEKQVGDKEAVARDAGATSGSGVDNKKKDAAAGAKKGVAGAKKSNDADKEAGEASPAGEESTDETIAAQAKTIASLRSQTDQSKRHVIQYQAMVSSLENTLTDQRKTADEIQESLQKQLKDRDDAFDKLNGRYKNLEEQKKNLLAEKVR